MIQKKSKGRIILIVLLVTIILAIGGHLFFAIYKPGFNFLKFSMSFIGIVIGLTFVAYILYYFGSKKKTSKETELEKIKEPVHTHSAINAWIRTASKHWGIEYFGHSGNPTDEHAIIIDDCIKFTDPEKTTSEWFLKFEAIINSPAKCGMAVVTIPLDYGEKYIENNWNANISWNKIIETENRDTKKFPLTSANSYNERFKMKALDLSEEGYSKSEIKEMTTPFMASEKNQVVQVVKKKRAKPKRIIESPSIEDFYENYEEPANEDDLANDANDYRNRVIEQGVANE